MYSVQELQKEIDNLMKQIIELGGGSSLGLNQSGVTRDPYQEENERIERYLSEFTVS